jgi:serine/threonine-protein kinase HipA
MAKEKERKEIMVYADWVGHEAPQLMGILSATPSKGKEIFSFEYADSWLESGFSQLMDPDLQLLSGPFYPAEEKQNFGMFLDSCPDRWGRVLMQRREAILAKTENRVARNLVESDFLLGVYDGNRMGGLRFKLEEEGPFLNDNKEMATPPWASLRELEDASQRYEENDGDDQESLKWINLLIAPGSSLGGARPKASVIDPEGNLWIAKFPSNNDERDIGAWEMVANELASKAGLTVAEGTIGQYKSKYNTYLTKRFDRTVKGKRIHFASAMTLLGLTDGTDHTAGISYLNIVEFISRHGANKERDLHELWRRIVFSICIKNTDDHLRNHGFLLTEKGWALSPAYDINPNEYGKELSLNISDKDNSLDINVALEVAEYFNLNKGQAENIIAEVTASINSWPDLAKKYGISRAEQDRMSGAFLKM